MKNSYLLDTHVLIWAQDMPEKLPAKIRNLLTDPSRHLWISAASIWEMAIKISLKKMKPLPEDFLPAFAESGFNILAISAAHAVAVQHLPLLHRDPFDRMLVAQAQLEKLTLITHDQKIAQYKVKTLVI